MAVTPERNNRFDATPEGSPPTVIATQATAADRSDWHRFLADHPAGDPLQDWAWAEVTAVGGERPVRLIARDASGDVRGVAQVLVRPTCSARCSLPTISVSPSGWAPSVRGSPVSSLAASWYPTVL